MTGKDSRPGDHKPATTGTCSGGINGIRPGLAPAMRTLRQRAEEISRQKLVEPLENGRLPTLQELIQTLHELQVHQIELEMQNEELLRSQGALEAAQARYFNFYDQAPVGYCTIDEHGLIIEANLTAGNLLGVARGGTAPAADRRVHCQSISGYLLSLPQEALCQRRAAVRRTADGENGRRRVLGEPRGHRHPGPQ